MDNLLEMEVEGRPDVLKRLSPTLFVGQSSQVGFYAIPALVDEHTTAISHKYIGSGSNEV
jgi:hypothetical protein